MAVIDLVQYNCLHPSSGQKGLPYVACQPEKNKTDYLSEHSEQEIHFEHLTSSVSTIITCFSSDESEAIIPVWN